MAERHQAADREGDAGQEGAEPRAAQILRVALENARRLGIHGVQQALGHLPQECRTALAKRHKTDANKFAQEALASGDELSVSRFLVEMALVEPAINAYSKEGGALIQSVAKRLRVPIERIAKDAAADFAARRKKRGERAPTPKRGKDKTAT